MNVFKKKYNFSERLKESKKILLKYPNHVPVIIQQSKNSKIPIIDKHKFIVPNEVTVGQFMYIIRKRIRLSPSKAMYIFVEHDISRDKKEYIIPTNTEIIGNLYNKYKAECLFLYVVINGENTFGNI